MIKYNAKKSLVFSDEEYAKGCSIPTKFKFESNVGKDETMSVYAVNDPSMSIAAIAKKELSSRSLKK